MGRPSKFSDELVKEIADRLCVGEPLAVICRDDHMPHPSTVRDWMTANEDVSRAIAHAREVGYDCIAAKARETARGIGESTADVQRDKLIIETDLKLLAKWDPKRYGDRQIIAGDKDAPLTGVSESDIDAKLAALLAKAQS